jgi:hypothetical protein
MKERAGGVGRNRLIARAERGGSKPSHSGGSFPQNRRLANKKSIPRSIAWETVLSVMIDTKEYSMELISLYRYSYEST